MTQLSGDTRAAQPLPTDKGGNTRIHLGYLDGLRGLASLYVVFHHFTLWSAVGLPHWVELLFIWTRFGHFAVDVFITLSGFCLMLPIVRAGNGEMQGGLWQFFARRARRILPPYWAALAFAVGLASLNRSFFGTDQLAAADIVSHIFLVHNLFPVWLHRLDMAMWSIATEWQIYFVFALLLLPVWKRWGSLAAIAVGFALGLIPHFALRPGANLDWACPWYIGLFALGMAGANLVFAKDSRFTVSPKWPLAISLLLLIPYAALKFAPGQPLGDEISPIEWIKDAVSGCIAVSFIVYCSLCSKNLPASSAPAALKLLSSRPVVLLGTFSYSIYLVHCLVLNQLERISSQSGLSPMHAFELRTFIGIPVALGLSYIFFLAFERPFLVKRRKEPMAELIRDVALSPAP